MKKYKVLFVDLDGTLIETTSGEIFPKGIWDMKWKEGILESIKKLQPQVICIVTNQGGIESGFVDQMRFDSKIRYVSDAITDFTGILCYYKYCSTNDRNCSFRKPNSGMLNSFLLTFKRYYSTDDCLMVGDASGLEGQFSDSDKKAAENFGCDYMDVNEFIEECKL